MWLDVILFVFCFIVICVFVCWFSHSRALKRAIDMWFFSPLFLFFLYFCFFALFTVHLVHCSLFILCGFVSVNWMWVDVSMVWMWVWVFLCGAMRNKVISDLFSRFFSFCFCFFFFKIEFYSSKLMLKVNFSCLVLFVFLDYLRCIRCKNWKRILNSFYSLRMYVTWVYFSLSFCSWYAECMQRHCFHCIWFVIERDMWSFRGHFQKKYKIGELDCCICHNLPLHVIITP